MAEVERRKTGYLHYGGKEMKKYPAIACIAAIPLLGGCLPLEQAPLVYTSKVTMGVNLSAGTPESPAPNVVIGYDQVDAAIVPVAVAKPCYKSTSSTCKPSSNDIHVIAGQNAISAEDLINQQLIDRAQRAIVTNQKVVDDNAGVIASENGKLKRLTDLSAKRTRFASLNQIAAAFASDPTKPALSADELAEQTKLKAEIDELALIEANQAEINRNIGALSAQSAIAATALTVAEGELKGLQAKIATSNSNTKSDALSVYGSFNGKADGTKEGASLTLGKVFSTGVAAQNLTEGIGAAAGADVFGRCLSLAHESAAQMLNATDDEKKIRLAMLIDYCLKPVGKPRS